MKLTMKSTGRVVIDGREFFGRNITINGSKVSIDGVEQDGELMGDVNINVFGDVNSLENTSGEITVSGSCGDIKTISGSVNVSGDSKNISTISGSVKAKSCGNVSTVSGKINSN